MKQLSSKRSIQILAHVLKQYNINHIVLSPGSRNAPLAVHFSEDNFHCYSIVDERSAAFVAMGMAKSLKTPVAVSCTSGSATANYYPAVVEAFYQNIPLLLLTADRPESYVDIFDGQTIRQNQIFHQHSYGDFQLKEDQETDAEEYNLDIVKKAVELCIEKQGPVHINIPLSEPLYNFVSEVALLPEIEKTLTVGKYELPSQLVATWNTHQRVMILLGTMDASPELSILLEQLVKNHSAVIFTEANSNQFHPKFFNHIDRYIFDFEEEDFIKYAPDLLITVGQNVVSKKIKQFLRKARPKHHWHVDPYWHPDTFSALTEAITSTHENFFTELIKKGRIEPQSYYNLWDVKRDKADAKHLEYCENVRFSDFMVYQSLAEQTPEAYRIHFSNSSAIRYAQLFNFSEKHHVYCNRGTSGIDGCTSTAMGFAIAEDQPTLLITGDLSFFYDINGLWNKYIPPYTRIIILNNGEGNIFRIIPGPSDANALEDYIATSHKMNAAHLAKHFQLDYFVVETPDELLRSLANFFKPSTQPKILEVNTKNEDNALVLKEYFKYLKS
ncbi:2-succinyl-5-enolpyruvyl-6-hydroxy-3-cyclohexene-1-carboxylic-acid synthase [Elizabethkingia sp. JS20170427COW]|uniref:2-succinyl-5-enolpyruvyl-6-hydroxy-3- cyclohexene-1-carboxylic-acid synthase n=1 Tax=Elizabethkingia sp. JS20170427COW TaxID=2583851 RepID=UPI001110F083|nr:2-succinyl-5-enolpyruvyl-6-hydroxy-3-cyclohexene-1-carboxylic-acid synthase [Elizabethkingia sp. JS20170427COW]QCX53173.1 2-succinyl-5-enolpyruvyl-6-hydroxy-3-cyclohexene-1-carboxylic-acid synthase [Elizabethkingia sp. JS20170427COW]